MRLATFNPWSMEPGLSGGGVAYNYGMKKTRVQEARERMGLSQRAFAAAAGVSRTPLEGWENRTHTPSGGYAVKVAKFAGLDMEDLFEDFEYKQVPRKDGGRVIA